jgi:hypothetical protein
MRSFGLLSALKRARIGKPTPALGCSYSLRTLAYHR